MNIKEFDFMLADAYALGYFDGRTHGMTNNPYDDDTQRYLYGQGYERGVSDYCDLDEGEQA
jgi:hypothetical protein